MIVKKTLTVILAVLMITAAFPSFVFAAEQEEGLLCSEPLYPELTDSPENMIGSVGIISTLVDTEAFREYLLGEFLKCSTSIPISEFNIPVSQHEYVADFIWYHMPEAYGVETISYSFYSHSGNIVNLTVKYSDFADTPEEYQNGFLAFEAKADELLSGIEGNSSLSDTEKALLLHDRLAVSTEYAFESDERIIHTAYGAFTNGLAVCQGYAMAYMYLLSKVGIESYYCSSDALNHGWNIVMINGKAYHVDVTWDDVSYGNGSGATGRVIHENFLRSTAGIKETGHTADDFDSTPVDTAFDSAVWQSSSAEFILLGNDIYYVEAAEGSFEASIKNMRTDAVIYSISEYWKLSSTSAWGGNYTCLTKAGNSLIFSLPKEVYKINPADGSTELIFAPSILTYYNIFGMTFSDGYIICDINNTPNDDINLVLMKHYYEAVCTHSATKTIMGTEPTCVSPGVTDSVFCNDCDILISGNTPIPALGHIEVVHTAKAPTCNDAGWDEYFICSRCDYSSYEEIPATGHTEVTDAHIAPTCTETGLSEGKHCSVCNFVITKQETIPALGHTPVSDAALSPTCTNTGLTAGAHCSVCNFVITKQETIPALGHTPVSDAAASPTCTNTGLTAGVHCSVCDSVITPQEIVPALGHTPVSDAAVSPTCTNTGLSAGAHCSVCDSVITPQEIVPALGHAEINHTAKTATCISKGYKAYVTCSRCDYSTYSETAIDSGNHLNTKDVPEVPATNESSGFTAGVFCEDCKKYISGHTEIPKIDAAFSDSENAKADGNSILVNSGFTAAELLAQAGSGAVIKDQAGTVINDTVLPATGMTLVFAGGTVMTLVIKGDSDCDGIISASDARLTLRSSVGLENFGDAQKKASDIDNDNSVSAADARLILRASVNLEDIRI